MELGFIRLRMGLGLTDLEVLDLRLKVKGFGFRA